MMVCVCDIGGTNFRIATYSDGELEEIVRTKTPSHLNYSEDEIKEIISSNIVKEFRQRKEKHPELNHLSVCFAGPVNNNGEVLASSVIFGTSLNNSFQLKDDLQKQLPDIHIHVVNDITAAAYRYMGDGNFCLITVSSSIGNKISINDQVIIDADGKTGEIGHYSILNDDFDIECTCGTGKNHVGMISSGRGIEIIGRMVADRNGKFRKEYEDSVIFSNSNGCAEEITAEMIAEAADVNDVFSQKLVDYCTVPLAHEICLLATALDLPRFIIIGGFALNCEYYLTSLKRNVKRKGIYNFSESDIERLIVFGEKDDNHGLIGAGILANKLET